MEKTENKIILIISVVLSLCAFVLLIITFLSRTQKTDEQVFNENINKVVEIRISNDQLSWGYGTGCFVSAEGLILTNKHMVFNKAAGVNYEFVEVRLPQDDEFISAEIVKVSLNSDLATIKINKTGCEFFEFASGVLNGQEIFTIGNLNGFGLSFIKGNVSASLRNVIYNDETIQAIQTSFVINEGNSGGPVFDNSGKLLGLISFRLKDNQGEVIQGVSFAIHLDNIKTFLQD